mgnify:CR=1 FL=1|tara:strand:+ start:498 stop:803 length:306 start_codon:yes stop_codon:yes gene_type:complete
MTPKSIIQQIENMFGRQPEAYLIQLMNDGLNEIAAIKQEYTVSSKTDLEQRKRWYALDDQVIDVTKVEILDTNDRYIMIPKLADAHRLLREDTDATDDSLT